MDVTIKGHLFKIFKEGLFKKCLAVVPFDISQVVKVRFFKPPFLDKMYDTFQTAGNTKSPIEWRSPEEEMINPFFPVHSRFPETIGHR